MTLEKGLCNQQLVNFFSNSSDTGYRPLIDGVSIMACNSIRCIGVTLICPFYKLQNKSTPVPEQSREMDRCFIIRAKQHSFPGRFNAKNGAIHYPSVAFLIIRFWQSDYPVFGGLGGLTTASPSNTVSCF